MIDLIVGSNIARIRRQKGFSVLQLASQCSLRADEIEACENGTCRLTPAQLLSVAAILNVSLLELFEGAEGMNPVDLGTLTLGKRASDA